MARAGTQPHGRLGGPRRPCQALLVLTLEPPAHHGGFVGRHAASPGLPWATRTPVPRRLPGRGGRGRGLALRPGTGVQGQTDPAPPSVPWADAPRWAPRPRAQPPARSRGGDRVSGLDVTAPGPACGNGTGSHTLCVWRPTPWPFVLDDKKKKRNPLNAYMFLF